MKGSKLSRRRFIKGIAASTAAVAAMPLVGYASQAETGAENVASPATQPMTEKGIPVIKNTFDFEWYKPFAGSVAFEKDPIDTFTETLNCDVVVCGGGLAGTSAALSAVDNNLDVVLIEKGNVFAGRGAQIGALGSRLQKEAGAEDIDPEAFIDDGMYSMGNRADRHVWERFAYFSGQAADWLVDRLGETCGSWTTDSPKTIYNNGVPFWGCTIMPAQMAGSVAPALGELIQAEGARVLFETPAVQLIKDGDKVTGVIAKSANGEYLRINASKGVVLATGGYENNWDMLCQSIRPRDLAVGTWRNPTTTNTGDGHLMGEAVGGQMDDYPHAIMNDPGASVKSHMYCRPLAQGFLRVNDHGLRFCNEGASQEHVGAAIAIQPHAHCFMILGGDIEANITELFTKRNLPFPIPDMVAALQSEVVEAQTLEELADLIGVNKENFLETIDKYNTYYDNQNDEEFGKDPSCLLAVKEGPFYAVEEQDAALVTVSGLKIDKYARVLDQFANPIDSLFAIGNVSGSMFDGYYPHHNQAISHGRCVTFGYLVGRYLAGIID